MSHHFGRSSRRCHPTTPASSGVPRVPEPVGELGLGHLGVGLGLAGRPVPGIGPGLGAVLLLELERAAPRASRAGRGSSARRRGCRRRWTRGPRRRRRRGPALVLHDAGHRVGHPGVGGGAGVPPVEVLELLDRVGRLADPHPLPHDGVQVDEPLAAQQLVELGLAHAVPPGQPLERGRLVGRVVVDVHARVGAPAGGSARRAGRGSAPPPRSWSCAHQVLKPSAAVPEPGEVLPALAVGGERVALEVEVDVAVARRRQAQQPAVGLRRQQLVGGLAGGPLAAPAGAPAGRAARGTVGRSCGAARSRRPRPAPRRWACPAAIRACRWSRAHAGDQREVVGLLPPGGAVRGPAALRAVRHRSRVGVGAGLDGACCRRARARRA